MKALVRTLLVLGIPAAVPASAFAHAEISPKVALSGQLQLFSLSAPTEKQTATTTKVVLTLPSGFSIDSFAPSPDSWTSFTSPPARCGLAD